MARIRRTAQAVALAVAALAAWLTTPAAAGTRHEDPALGWGADVPTGWVVMDAAALSRRQSDARSAAPGVDVRYVAGFAPPGDDRRTPYVLAQWLAAPLGQSSWADVEAAFGQADMSAMARSMPGVDADVTGGRVTVDRARGRMEFQLTAAGPDGRRTGRSVGYFAENGLLYLHCYAMEDEFARHAPAFASMVDSFAWRPPGQPFDGEGGSSIDWGRALQKGVSWALISAFVGGVLHVVRGKKRDDPGSRRRRTLPTGAEPAGGPHAEPGSVAGTPSRRLSSPPAAAPPAAPAPGRTPRRPPPVAGSPPRPRRPSP